MVAQTADALKEKLWDAYFTLSDEVVYLNSANPMEIYVKGEKRYYDAMSFLSLVTAITPRGSLLYVGGHGNSKTSLAKALAVMVGGIEPSGLEQCVLRIHQDLTEEKIIASMNLGKLVKDGTVEYKVRKWVESKWKIADEINRAPGEITNMLLSGLGEGVWKYEDEAVVECGKQIADQKIFATINPYGEGTFEMSPPMLDRFDMAVPALPADSADFAEIGDRKDTALHGTHFKKIMNFEELVEAAKYADQIPLDADAKLQMRYFSKEISLCDKAGGDKSLTDRKPSEGLCKDCHYATDLKLTGDSIKNPCQMFDEAASARSYEKWTRVAKRAAWLLGEPTVTVEIAAALQPYMFYHRVGPNDQILNKHPFNGNKLKFVKKAWSISQSKLQARTEAEERYLKLLCGEGSDKDLKKLEEDRDLVVRYDMLPHVRAMEGQTYKDLSKRIGGAASITDLTKLQFEVRKLTDLPMGVQNELRGDIRKKRKELAAAGRK